MIGVCADEHCARFGGGLHARGQGHALAHRRVFAMLAGLPHAAHDDLAGIDAHAHLQTDVLSEHLFGKGPEGLVHRQRREDCALRVILMRVRRAEERNQPIPAELVHMAPETIDLGGQQLQHLVHHLYPGFGAQVLHQVSGVAHIGQDDGRDAAFAGEWGSEPWGGEPRRRGFRAHGRRARVLNLGQRLVGVQARQERWGWGVQRER